MKDRRTQPRVQTRRKVGVVLSSGDVLQLWTHDISKDGVQLLSPYNADIGDLLSLYIAMPSGPSGEHVRINMRARVAHVTYSGGEGCYRVGFQIKQFLDSGGQEIWESWIEQKLDQHFSMQGLL